MNRVAFFSPLPPETSGIADYSAELLPALAHHLELEVFTADPRATASLLSERLPLRAFSEFVGCDQDRRYDAVIYQIGNSAVHHGAIYRQLLARPGIVVLHEYMLHNLIRDLALAGTGRAEFIEEMRYCYGTTGSAMAGRLLHANNLPEMWSYPLFERIVDCAQGLIVHSRTTRDRVLASRPTARIDLVPHHLSLSGFDSADRVEESAIEDRRVLLAAHGIDPAAFVVASFGHLTASKHLDVSLEAFATFRLSHPAAVYLLVGEISEAYPRLREMLEGELGHGVVTTGRVSLDDLQRYMAACDVAVNLRYPTGGETSGACLRLLGHGRPTIVSDVGWFSEIPSSCCARVASGSHEAAEIAALLGALAGNETLRTALGANAAEWAAECHRLADSARGYADVVARSIDDPPEPYRPSPPLAAAPPDLAVSLIEAISAGLGDLGLTEEDSIAHQVVAEALVDLDLDFEPPATGQ